jgi:alanine-glyoxylate transaminase/serine-glyoxylate transaminase/serine-pyruvate transaminase
LNAPTGLSPITLSDRFMDLIRKRPRKLQSYYLDLALFEQYWAGNPFYHHTPPTTFYYALLEALRVVEEEGLEARWARHRLNHQALVAGVEAMGLEMHVEPAYRLWTLNTVKIPEGVDDAKVRGRLLRAFGIEIGGGWPLKGGDHRWASTRDRQRPAPVRALGRILPTEAFPVARDRPRRALARPDDSRVIQVKTTPRPPWRPGRLEL